MSDLGAPTPKSLAVVVVFTALMLWSQYQADFEVISNPAPLLSLTLSLLLLLLSHSFGAPCPHTRLHQNLQSLRSVLRHFKMWLDFSKHVQNYRLCLVAWPPVSAGNEPLAHLTTGFENMCSVCHISRPPHAHSIHLIHLPAAAPWNSTGTQLLICTLLKETVLCCFFSQALLSVHCSPLSTVRPMLDLQV